MHVERRGMPESPRTTHVCVSDKDGGIVTMAHSLGMMSGVITPGLGFMYNGCMAVFDPRPGRAGSIAPGKSRFSSVSPSILFDNGRPVLAIGAPGGTQIVMGVLQAILNFVDFGMTLQEAVLAPRFSATSDTILVTARIPRYGYRELEADDYRFLRSPYGYQIASVHAIGFDADGDPSGGADICYGVEDWVSRGDEISANGVGLDGRCSAANRTRYNMPYDVQTGNFRIYVTGE